MAIERHGRVAQVLPEAWNLTLAQQWKIQHGFKHSNGKCYYQNDIFEDQHSTYIIGFNGYSFYYTAKSKSTFYDVNYGGQRHSVGTYIISVKCPHCGYSEQCQSYDKQQVKDIKDKMRFHIRQCYYQRNRRIYGENDY